MTATESNGGEKLPKELIWLADAPLFIDSGQVQRFFDAVVQPASRVVRLLSSESQSTDVKLAAKAKAGVTLDFSKAFGLLSGVFSGLGKASVEGEAGGEADIKNEDESEVEYVPIESAQRQLLALTLHYLSQQSGRIFLIDDPSDESWRDPAVIADVPRTLVFLEFHGKETNDSGATDFGTMLIPTAAEFSNGKIVPIYPDLTRKSGERPPKYPETGERTELNVKRREYWNWFREEFSADQAMRAIEAAASSNGRIRWIDFRVPITNEGDTLHLHIVPAADYDTGVFAYNFVKRAYKHGIRLVGTLKSEPDMNVLAIYER